MQNCYCNSEKKFSNCCGPIISGKASRNSAEICMRSRYTAFCLKNIDYIVASTFPTQRKYYPKKSLESWTNSVSWLKLEILSASENRVEFKAYFTENSYVIQTHHEKSLFKEENGNWYFYAGEVF